MSWHERRLAAFDLETTGIDSESDRIVTAAVSLVGDGAPSVFRAWLLDPGVEIPAGASAVHGITTERARAEGRPPREAIEEIVAALAEQLLVGVPIVAFNARFDLTCLDRDARRHGVVPLLDRVGGAAGMLVVDPFVLDKQVDRYRKGKRTLGAVCAHYRVPLDEAHAANADALAAARVAWRLGEAYPELREVDLPTLHRQQVEWAAEQAVSFEDYLRRNGREERIEPAWPIVPAPDAPAPVPVAAPPLAA
ncbi:MAG TPA: exonuclease domain-containing protein [Conexibacter sp.]|jgi:DNA polymerase-3 subunit epsilon|nr:exonuclease domain-containing protein [Conexibacter sp.]